VVVLKWLRNLADSTIEILTIVKACLTTFWFWVPVLFSVSFYLNLLLMFAIHPLVILVLPIVLVVFAMIQEEKRVKAQYGLDEVRVLKASHGLGEGPVYERKTWDVEKAVKDYEESLKKKEET
jgi:hypothetical protein